MGTVKMRTMQGTISQPYQLSKGSLIGTVTGIDAISTKVAADSKVYNLGGQQTSDLQRGVNIIRTNDGRTVKVVK